MAFKILTFDELELLTENQRKCYEEELAIYNERVKFVEQIERFENTVITPYEPKFISISDISKAPGNGFLKPEYVHIKIEPVVKPESGVSALYFAESVIAVVPKFVKIKSAPVGHMKKMEHCKPILPSIFKIGAPASCFVKADRQPPVIPKSEKISIPGNTFRKSEYVSPNLPVVVRPINFRELFFSSITIDSSAIIENKPEIAEIAFGVPAFSIPKYVVPILPRPAVELPEVKLLKLSAQASPVLPKVIVPRQAKVLLKQIDGINAKLPKVLGAPTVNASFDKPEIQREELPTLQKLAIPAKKYMKSEFSVLDLPIVGMPKVRATLFSAPEPRKIMLMTITKPMAPRPLGNLSVDNTPKMEHPSIDVLSIEPFKKVQSKASGLPTVSEVAFPDINAEELKKIKLLLLKADRTKKEEFA